MAYTVCAFVLWNVWTLLRSPQTAAVRNSALLLLAGVLAQIALGIWTLLEAVPLGLGIAHQAGAAVLLVIAVRHLHVLRRQPAQYVAVRI